MLGVKGYRAAGGGGEGGHKKGEASLGVASGPCADQTNNRPSIVLPGGG